ncbi:hypothetical protein [Streptomyces sp. NPDC059538]|uniref:hypothetical protein n=1 Tax=Streptomyces sp. NPDC059538 TaxID=3346860 RepID=UPI003694D375
MTFPQTPLDIQVDLMIDGAWTDITSDVYFRDEIHIKRGKANESGQVTESSCSLTLNNRSGKYSPRNPIGVYYRKIGRNTPIRVSVNAGTAALDVTSSTGQRASTADHASLDIVGDIDVRFQGRVDDWSPYEASSLMGKWLETGDQRSWQLGLYRGYLQLLWTTTGTAFSVHTISSTERLNAAPGGQLAVRATLDVNNGASGHTVTFYTSSSLSGTWTQLGSPVITSGTTSIFSSSAGLDTGHMTASATPGSTGRIQKLEVRSGIAGSAVANPDFTAQAVGATSFSDGAGRTWTSAAGLITNRRTRFAGEVTSWPTRWDTSGQDIYTPIEAAGILRRLGRRQPPFQSSMRRELGSPEREGIVAYWPCEDGSEATVLASAIEYAPPLTWSGTLRPAGYSGWAASGSLPVHSADSYVTGSVPPHSSSPGYISLRMFVDVSQAITGTPLLVSLNTTGSRSYSVYVNSSGDLKLIIVNTDTGSTMVDSGFLTFGIGLEQVELALDLSRASVDVDWALTVYYLDRVAPTTGTTYNGTVTLTAVGATTTIAIGSGLDGVAFGHVAISNILDGFNAIGPATLANRGETAAARIARLAAEEGIPVLVSGAGTEQLGSQRAASLLELWREAEDADQGLLYESRNAVAAAYRDLTSFYNQTPVATLVYGTDLMPPLDPEPDDQQTLNAVTVQRTGGATGYASLDEGPLSIQEPPNGVGRYSEAFTRNLYADNQTTNHAGWMVNLGTVDEDRYPIVRVALQASPSLIDTATELDCGDRFQITGPPAKLPPGTIDQLVLGYSEVLWQYGWDLLFNCAPASPYAVGVFDDAVLGRFDTDGSTLAVAASSSATTLVVHTTQGADGMVPIWTEDAADYPFDLRLAGEVVTATAATSLAEDTFTRTVAAGSWGTASDGHSWTLTGGVSNNERSVASNRGVVTVSASQTLHRQQTVSETCMDCDVRVQMAVSATATGGTLNACVLLRWSSATNHYRARVEFLTGGTVSVSVTSGATIIGSNAATGLSYTAGAVFEVRVRIIGYRVLMRVWPTGTAEPTVWHIDRTDVSSSFASGAVGLSAHGASGNTNTGLEYRFDSFDVVTPQRMTVTRSVNGVTKSQAVGEDVRLATPTILAL